MARSDLGPTGIASKDAVGTLRGNRIDDPRVEMARNLTKKVLSELLDQVLTPSDAYGVREPATSERAVP